MRVLTSAQIAAIRAPQQSIRLGLDLLNQSDQFVMDLSGDMQRNGSVKHQNYADIHGTFEGLVIARELDWGTDRVRPWMTINGERFNLGVYIMTTPSLVIGDSIQTYSVTGYDKLQILSDEVGDSYWIAAGESYIESIHQVIVDSGFPGLSAVIDNSAADKLLDQPMVWALDTNSPTTWLRIINDLLAKIGYWGLWADQDGILRSSPYQPLGTRGEEWTFDVGDRNTNIVYQDRSLDIDEFYQYNWWRFIRKDYPTALSEANGQYTVDRSFGQRKVKKVRELDAADQQTLIALGDQEVESDLIRTRTVKIKTGALPALGHFDVFAYDDPALGIFKAQARNWSLDLATGRTDIEMEVVV